MNFKPGNLSEGRCYSLNDTGMLGDERVIFPHSPILHYEFSSWIDKTTIKTIHGNEMVDNQRGAEHRVGYNQSRIKQVRIE